MRFRKVYVEITNICNRSCVFCPGTQREKARLTEPQFCRILEQLQGQTEYLYFHLMGEPLLHPQLARFLQLAGAYGFRVILTTNGTLLPEKQEILLAADSLHKVNISLHSFEANDGGSMEDYLLGCTQFAKAAAAKGITVSFRLWNEDGKTTKGLHLHNGEILDVLHREFSEAWQENARGSRLQERVYLNGGERFDWPSLTAEDHGTAVFCYGLKDQLGILCDGTVVPCCLDSEGSIPLGNLLTQPLAEIISAPRTQAIIEGFRRRNVPEDLCRRCGYAQRF